MNVLVDGEILLYGTVGGDFFLPGFTDRDVAKALSELGRNSDVTVRINSGGGYQADGVAIYNALKAHKGKVTAYVDGVAHSSASIIAMGADELIFRRGATMMIHDPQNITLGDSRAHKKSQDRLETEASGMADIYAEKSGMTADECRDYMREETWFSAEDAVAEGFADAVDSEDADEPTAFNYRAYRHAPDDIVALADARGWSKAESAMKKSVAASTDEPTTPRRSKATQEAPKMTDAERKAIADDAAAAATKAAEDKAKAEAATKASADAATKALSDSRTLAADIAKVCAEGGVPSMASELIVAGVTLDVAKERVGATKAIRDACTMARVANPALSATMADDYLKAGKTLAEVNADLLAKLAAGQGGEIIGSHAGAAPPVASGPGDYQPRKSEAADALKSWDKTIEQFGGKKAA